MATWLSTLLTGVLVPIIEDIFKKMNLDSRLSSIEAQNTAMIKGLGELAAAQTVEEKKHAIEAIAGADSL